jgi:hypothetical protein
MAEGLILKSASFEPGGDAAREEHLEATLEAAGYEVAQPEVPAAEGDSATLAGKEPSPRKSRKERAVERATAPLLEKIKQLETGAGTVRPVQAEAVEARPKPQKADFANDEEWEAALIAWGTQKALTDKAHEDAQAAERQFYEQNLRNYGAQTREAKTRYKDWDAVVNQDIYIGRDAQLAILEQENGAEVIYWLGKNPAHAKKLGEMRPVSAIREVERLSVRLAGGGPSGERPRPKVPAPVRTVSTAGTSEPLSFAEIAARPNYPGKARDLKRAQRD